MTTSKTFIPPEVVPPDVESRTARPETAEKQPTARSQLFARILVAVDHPLHPAVKLAIKMAELASASLYLVTVVERPVTFAYADAYGYVGETYDQMLENAGDLLKKCKAETPAEIPVQCLLREGTASFEIAEAAREVAADLIVIGTHRRGAIKRLFLGSTSAGVIPKVQCPVLLVSDGNEEPAAIQPEKGEVS